MSPLHIRGYSSFKFNDPIIPFRCGIKAGLLDLLISFQSRFSSFVIKMIKIIFIFVFLYFLVNFTEAQDYRYHNQYPYYGSISGRPGYLYYNGYSQGDGKGLSTWEQSITQRLFYP